MQGILVILQGVYLNHFKCIYLKNQKLFVDIFRIYIKFWTFFKKRWVDNLSISEIIYSEKRGSLNA